MKKTWEKARKSLVPEEANNPRRTAKKKITNSSMIRVH